MLHEPRFADKAPAEVYATLLDEGRYLCSERTMYRVLAASQEVRERRDQLRHPHYKAPELLATAPNQLWSWDITKLLGPQKWTYFYLYVLLDVFSRYVVGWLLADRESATLADKLISESYERQGIVPGQLTVHADRGAAMISKTVAFLLADLGVTKSHSRPHVSNDNPFSEAQFKTLKYRPGFPERFGSREDARSHCQAFFPWYNDEHRHSGLGLAHARRRAPRPRAGTARSARDDPRCRAPGASRALRERQSRCRRCRRARCGSILRSPWGPAAPKPPAAPVRPAQTARSPSRSSWLEVVLESLNCQMCCLIRVDRFRSSRSTSMATAIWRRPGRRFLSTTRVPSGGEWVPAKTGCRCGESSWKGWAMTWKPAWHTCGGIHRRHFPGPHGCTSRCILPRDSTAPWTRPKTRGVSLRSCGTD